MLDNCTANYARNLGNKNCEPGHITEIVKPMDLAAIRKKPDEIIAAKSIDNSDFGYHKVTIERP
jgi:type I restriction enzyme M protein